MVSLFLSSSLFLHQHLHYYALLPFLLFVSSSSRLLFVFCSFLSLLLTFSLLLRCFSCHLLRSCTFYKWLCACLIFAAVWRARGTTTRVSLAYFAVTSFACFFPSIMLHCVYYACFDQAVLCCITRTMLATIPRILLHCAAPHATLASFAALGCSILLPMLHSIKQLTFSSFFRDSEREIQRLKL